MGFIDAATMRLLGLVGLIALVIHRNRPLLLIGVTIILYSVLLVMFNRLSRYRVPIEPALMILGVFGVDILRRQFLRHRRHDDRESEV